MAENRRSLLVVSYHYGAGSATGGFRWHALARGLAERGWRVDVLTAESVPTSSDPLAPRVLTVPPEHQQSAVRRLLDSRSREVSDDGARAAAAAGTQGSAAAPSRALQDSPSSPAGTAQPAAAAGGGPLRWLRSIVGRTLHGIDTLATDMRWVHRALGVARAAAKDSRWDVVLVSAPPMPSLLIGRTLSEELGIPFIADYRDPWFFGAGPLRLKSDPISWAAAGVLDRMVQRSATVVVHNTDRARRAVEAELPSGRTKRTVVINGYDGTLPDVKPDRECFRVLYGGWIHPYMDPQPLLLALGRLRARVNPSPGKFVVEFLGSPREFGGVPMLDLTTAAGLAGCVEQTDRVPRAEAIARQQRAAVLAALDYPHGNAVVMKFYDYAQMYGTMLLIGRRESALAEASARISVPVIEPEDEAGLDARLHAAWERWQRGDFVSVNDAEQRFARRHSIAQMDELLASAIRAGAQG